MLAFVLSHPVAFALLFAAIVSALALLRASTVVIREDESGLVVRRFGKPLPPGRLIALEGEAGYQAELLPPGWHFGRWPWLYKLEKVPMTVVRPGEIGLVMAQDGAPIPAERVLAKEVECNRFQDAEAFLRQGGEKGRQIGLITAGAYRINPAIFKVITPRNALQHGVDPAQLHVFQVPNDRVGVVMALDGRPIPTGELAGPPVKGHDSFQSGGKYIAARGCRGLQEEVLLSGSFTLNPWFVSVELVPLTEVPIGHVGVVVSYVGGEHLDVTGDGFTHGDLVERGHKGVWVEPLLPGKHPINPKVMKVELVPTTNIVLNWSQRTEAHNYDARLAPIVVRSRDGFGFHLEVSQIIHVGAKNAPRVISRVGSMQNLVDHVLQPTVGNYFRNSAQEVSVLEFLSARTERQSQAFDAIREALGAYDVECIDTLIGEITPPGELMKTQTDRKIAEELQRTFDVQREAQVRRQALERETSIAEQQREVVRAEQAVRVATEEARAIAERAKGDGAALQTRSMAEAAATIARGDAEATATRARMFAEADGVKAKGDADAAAFVAGVQALGAQAFTSVQLATVLASHGVKLVPDVAVGSGGAAEAVLGRLLAGSGALGERLAPVTKNGTNHAAG